jgi:predicted dienelactone hydrolase
MRFLSRTRAVVALIVVALIVAVALHHVAAQRYKPAPDPTKAYKLSRGPFAVETNDLTIYDGTRKKDLQVRLLVPGTGGPFPVIVFSHGAGGSGRNYFQLTDFWASHGYVVIQPTHDDSIALRREKGERIPSSPRELIDEYRFDSDGWRNRALDISFVIDSFGEFRKLIPSLKTRMDTKRIGMGGHSYGAFTTQMIGGALVDIPNGPKAQSFRDDRPRALLLLSGQGKNQNGLTEASWRKMDRPMMSMTGTYDNGAMNQVAEWRKDPFTYSPPGDKYHVFIDNAFHMSFTGALVDNKGEGGRLAERPIMSRLVERTDQKAVFDYVKIASIAFWDAYLKDDANAKTYLKTNGLVSYSNNSVKVDQK